MARAVGRWVFIFLEAWLLEEVGLWFGELDGDQRSASFVEVQGALVVALQDVVGFAERFVEVYCGFPAGGVLDLDSEPFVVSFVRATVAGGAVDGPGQAAFDVGHAGPAVHREVDERVCRAVVGVVCVYLAFGDCGARLFFVREAVIVDDSCEWWSSLARLEVEAVGAYELVDWFYLELSGALPS
jgi:hypothetical protein